MWLDWFFVGWVGGGFVVGVVCWVGIGGDILSGFCVFGVGDYWWFVVGLW